MMPVVFGTSFGILLLAAFLILIRILKGPHSVDRVLSLDLLGVLCASLFALFAAWMGEEVYLDATLASAMIAFLSTILLTKEIERRGRE